MPRPTHVTCPECGGYGSIDAATFGDYGRHPCYHCGTLGVIPRSQALDRARGQRDALRQSRAGRKAWVAERARMAEKYRQLELAIAIESYAYPDRYPF